MTVNGSIVIDELPDKEQVTIMDIEFTTLSKEALLRDYFSPLIKRSGKCFVVTANPEIVMNTRGSLGYKEVVQSSDIVVPDGIGIIAAAKIKKLPLTERVPGIELMGEFLQMANEQELSCYFLGAREHVSHQLVEAIRTQYPHLRIAGYHHGYFEDDTLIVKQIKESKPDFVFVAMGSPRQEEWIAKHYGKFSKGLFMGVGGSFDVFAGEVKRAPESWIRLNLEWLYRLLRQPYRVKGIWKSVKFMWLILMRRG